MIREWIAAAGAKCESELDQSIEHGQTATQGDHRKRQSSQPVAPVGKDSSCLSLLCHQTISDVNQGLRLPLTDRLHTEQSRCKSCMSESTSYKAQHAYNPSNKSSEANNVVSTRRAELGKQLCS